jgi:type I restriction enzyme S subunit
MKLEKFFEKFEIFADAPEAVAKMRELILESALRGKLVSQDARDEPASLLVRKLEAQLSASGSKQLVLPPVGDDAYLRLPAGWAWTRLGNTGRIFNGDSVSEIGKVELAKVEEGLPFIATKDVGYGRDSLAYDNGLKVPIGDRRFKVARANAVLICAEGGSAGRKIGLCDRDICFGNKLFANEVREGLDHRFIFYVYQAPSFFKEFAARMTGIIGGIARSDFLSLPIPMPPLAEQKRIVAKVDELMVLCDQLEAQQQARETQQAALARASLARFADAPTPANLHLLFHKSYAIPPADLRKSIITLAVQGKLVPQDSNDESAEEILRVVTAGPFSSDSINAEEPAEESEVPFSLPSSWKWIRLRNVASIKHGYAFSSELFTTEPTGFVLTTPGNFYESGGFRDRGANTKYYKGEVPPAFVFQPGDLIIPMTEQAAGLLGSPAFIPDDGNTYLHNQRLGKLEMSCDEVAPAFVYWFFNSEFFRSELARTCTGMKVRHTSPKRILNVPFPLCPLAEQRRIVAKVSELMALVDALETHLATAHKAGSQLIDATVAELTQERALA